MQKGEYKRREARMCGRRKRKKPRETAVEVFCEFSFEASKKRWKGSENVRRNVLPIFLSFFFYDRFT